MDYTKLLKLALNDPKHRHALLREASMTRVSSGRIPGLQISGSLPSVYRVQTKLALARSEWTIETILSRGNLGIPRHKMPQIEGEGVPQFLRGLQERGVAVVSGRMPVGQLYATQRELNAEKVEGMIASAKSGDHAFLTERPVIVSKDNHILDGHHRWAALLVMSPKLSMPVHKVDLTIQDLLDAGHDFDGVTYKSLKD